MIGVSPSPEAPIMPSNDDFEPHLGRLSDKGRKPRPRKFISRVIAAANLARGGASGRARRSEEHTSELQSLMRISYAVFCLKKKKKNTHNKNHTSRTTRT